MARFNFPQFRAPAYDQRTMQTFVDDVERALIALNAQIQAMNGQTGSGGVTVHNDLSGRDAANAHPQGAITGLVDALATKAPQSEVDSLDGRVALLEADGGMASLIQEVDDTGQSNPQVLYIGKAAPGSATNQPVWQIQRITIEADDDSQVRFAGGSADFNQVWDNRLSLIYS